MLQGYIETTDWLYAEDQIKFAMFNCGIIIVSGESIKSNFLSNCIPKQIEIS